MLKNEAIHLEGLIKTSHIILVITSCKTMVQIENADNWAFDVMNRHYRSRFLVNKGNYYTDQCRRWFKESMNRIEDKVARQKFHIEEELYNKQSTQSSI